MVRLYKLVVLIICLVMTGCKEDTKPPVDYDVVVYGGTSAGVIAAYSAKMMDKSVVLIETGTRLGGLTAGGLGQTDIGNKHAVTGLSRNFYRRLGEYYGTFEQWKFEPKAALQIYNDMIEEAGIPVLYSKRIREAKKQDNVITQISLEDFEDPGAPIMDITGSMFIDATYEGDLLALAGVSFTVGRESNEQYGETINGVQLMEGHQFPDGVDPYKQPEDPESGLLWGISKNHLEPNGSGDDMVQAYNFRICLTNDPENMVPITRPEAYDSTRYELLVRLFEAQPEKRSLNDYFIWSRMPNNKTDINNRGGFSTDMIGMNYEYPEGSYEDRARIIRDHEIYTKGLLYFYGHDPRVPEELQAEMLKWGYPKDEYVDNDHWSPQLYVREARRMIGEYVMTEHHCRGDNVVSDPVALAAYTMDSHNCQRLVVNGMVKNEGNVEVGGFPPYPISYRALIPKREECENLFVPVCLSASHIAFGSIRMEPVFMVLGQVSAVAASMAIDNNVSVHGVNVDSLRHTLGTDPHLDGTRPDLLIDDADRARIEINGDWESQSHFMLNYKSSLLISNDSLNPDLSVKFVLPDNVKGKYKAYYYCPGLSGVPQEELPEYVTLLVKRGDMEEEVRISYAEKFHDWALLGVYELGQEQENYIQLVPEKSDTPYIADAVLLVAEN